MVVMSTHHAEGPAPPPKPPDIWRGRADSSPTAVHYTVWHPWSWVMKLVANNVMTEVSQPSDLPSANPSNQSGNGNVNANTLTPASRRRVQKKVRNTLQIELSDRKTGLVDFAAHGTSTALDGLEDKDELVRTLQRCRCEKLNLSPPSILINWDVTHEECLNVIGDALPSLEGNNAKDKVAVLKEPMGSQGQGIYFLNNAEDIHKVINEHHQRAMQEPQYLDNLIAAKGRIPSWVLQAEVIPCLLVRDRRKFHIRTYLVLQEKLHHPDLFDIFIFNRHEIRVAGVSVEDSGTERDRLAHITNGALSATTERLLLSDEPELVARGIQEKVEVFVAEAFGKHLVPDIARRVGYNGKNRAPGSIVKFAVAGIDLMVTENNRVYMLEVNVNPSVPKEPTVSAEFKDHLTGFMHDLVDLVVGRPAPNFVSAFDILEQKGLLD